MLVAQLFDQAPNRHGKDHNTPKHLYKLANCSGGSGTNGPARGASCLTMRSVSFDKSCDMTNVTCYVTTVRTCELQWGVRHPGPIWGRQLFHHAIHLIQQDRQVDKHNMLLNMSHNIQSHLQTAVGGQAPMARLGVPAP
jgi:hypothetical protein